MTNTARTSTIIGVPAPLHLPAAVDAVEVLDDIPAHLGDDPVREAHRSYIARSNYQSSIPAGDITDDTIVVDVEVNAAGQIVITGAEREA